MPPEPTLQLSASEFQRFQTLLVKESGLYFDAHRLDTLRGILIERMQHQHLSTLDAYYAFLTHGPASEPELKCLIELLTIGETYFFRDYAQFNALTHHVLVPLIQERSQSTRTLTVWCAGCSTGEEPYSLAIQLLETLPCPEFWTISLLATDVNREALKKAQKAVYSPRSVQQVPSHWLKKYFTLQNQKYALHENVKNRVRFDYLNLIKDPFIQPGLQDVDILFCRNVMIYFPLNVTKQIVTKFKNSLRDGGYFFIGGAETLWQVSDQFTPVELPDAMLYRKGAAPVPLESKPFIDLPGPMTLPPSTPPLKAASPAPVVLSEYQKASILANQGHYPESLLLLSRILQSDSLLTEAHYLQGVVFERLGELEKAKEAFKRVIYINPALVLAYVALGNLYRYQKHYGKARREFENALKTLASHADDDKVSLSEDITCGLLRAVCNRNLESLHA